MLIWIYWGIVLITVIRTVSFAIYQLKNKKRGAIPLFVLSFVLLVSPILTAIINKII